MNRPTGILVLPEGASYKQIRDEWIEITGMGAGKREFLLANDGRETAIEQAKTEYVYDRIGLDELEDRVEAALQGWLISTQSAIGYYQDRIQLARELR